MRKLVAALSIVGFAACSESSGPRTGPPAALLVLAGGTPQVGVFGQALPVRPTVLVTDADNRPVSGVSVSFSTTGGGTMDAPVQQTDAKGSASVAWTMGNSFGTRTLTANVQGLEPVTFTASAIAPDAGVLAFSIADPVGDTLAFMPGYTRPAIDLVALRGDFKRDSLIVTATFSGPVSPGGSAPNALGGFVEIDIDDNSATGEGSFSNAFGASAAVGVEYVLSFFSSDGFSLDLLGLTQDAEVASSFSGNTVVARIPMSKLANDDGNFSIVGVFGTIERPTDLIPNSGQTQVRRGLLFGASSANVVIGDAARPNRAPASVVWGGRTMR